MKKNKIDERKFLIIVTVALVVLLVLGLVIFKLLTKDNEPATYEQAVLERKEKIKEIAVQDLSGMTEQERMEFYCAQFFKYVSVRDFDSAYDMLYREYKENFFPTIESFERYMLDYFPSEVSVRYNNLERLGDIYVLWVHISDVYNGTYGHNFDMNIVIREDAYNDIVMSFSRNSAVEGMEGESYE